MNVVDIVDGIKDISLARSRIYNGGTENYPFAFGWLCGELARDLEDLGLNKRQLKVLADRLAVLESITKEQAS